MARSRISEVTPDNSTQHAADCIRDAIVAIWWTQDCGGNALTNAWAALNSALTALGEQPLNFEPEIRRWFKTGEVA